MPVGLALSAPMAEVTDLEEIEKPEMSIVQDFPIKIYLTWREILSGGIKVPRSLAKQLSHAREYTFTDPDENKPYTVYYFPNENFFLGLQDFYSQHNIPQGSSLTLERTGPAAFKFWVKRSKKKMSVIRLGYDAEKDEFVDTGEEVYTFAEPNKIIYIERETLASLMPLAPLREGHDLRDLVVTIYGDPGLATSAHTLHFLRAYHLIDIVRQTTQEDVEFTLLNSPEFTKSDKKKGVFTYHEPYIPEEEAPAEAAYPEGYEEPAPEAYTPEEAALEAVAEELFGASPETVRETPRREPPGPVPARTGNGPAIEEGQDLQAEEAQDRGRQGPAAEEERAARHRGEDRRGGVRAGRLGRRQGKRGRNARTAGGPGEERGIQAGPEEGSAQVRHLRRSAQDRPEEEARRRGRRDARGSRGARPERSPRIRSRSPKSRSN